MGHPLHVPRDILIGRAPVTFAESALKGRVSKIQKNICAILSKIISGKTCAHDKRTKREKERPERAASPQPRATPWVSVYKRLRPVRAKAFALTGRREWGHGTQGVALGCGLAGLSARAGPQTKLFPHNLPPLNISILNTQPPAAMPHSHQIKKLPPSATI